MTTEEIKEFTTTLLWLYGVKIDTIKESPQALNVFVDEILDTIKSKEQIENNYPLTPISFAIKVNEKGFGTIVGRNIGNVGTRSITIPTKILFEELEAINVLLQKYDLYVDMDNKLRSTTGFWVSSNFN